MTNLNKAIAQSLQQKAMAYVMAKGLGVVVLVCYCIMSSYFIKRLDERTELMRIQMFQLQNDVIKDNTKSITEFNLINKNK